MLCTRAGEGIIEYIALVRILPLVRGDRFLCGRYSYSLVASLLPHCENAVIFQLIEGIVAVWFHWFIVCF